MFLFFLTKILFNNIQRHFIFLKFSSSLQNMCLSRNDESWKQKNVKQNVVSVINAWRFGWKKLSSHFPSDKLFAQQIIEW